MKSRLPNLFLPYGQVAVGVTGGMEAAIHTLRSYIITSNWDSEDLCCVKNDFRNAFNKRHREHFTSHVKVDLPDLFASV